VSDDPNAYNKNYHARMQAEIAEANTPQARAQAVIDRWWQDKIDARAWARRREIPETGAYDPMRRFTEEMDYEEELAGRRYRREVR
jgi:hypothetical protein